LLGAITKRITVKSSEVNISISGMEAGIYIVSIGGKSKMQLLKE